MTGLTLVSVDLGNGRVKARSSQRIVNFHSVSASEQGTLKFNAGLTTDPPVHPDEPLDRLIIGLDGQRHALGKAAWSHGRQQVIQMGQGRVSSEVYRRLFAGALAATVRRSDNLAVIASLPVEWYNRQREEARDALAGLYTVDYGGVSCTYVIDREDLHIVPEGFGALCSVLLAKNGVPVNKDLARATVGVVDIGTLTTDLLFFDRLTLFPANTYGYSDTGVSSLWQYLKDEISTQHGRKLKEHELDHALQAGYFMLGNERIDIYDLIDSGAAALAETVRAHIDSVWDNGYAVQSLIFTGGGAPLIGPYMIEHYANCLLIEDPFYANCEGAYRFALYRDFAHERIAE